MRLGRTNSVLDSILKCLTFGEDYPPKEGHLATLVFSLIVRRL